MVFKSLKTGFQWRKILEIKVFKAENPWNQGFHSSNSCMTLKSRFSKKMLFAEECAQIFFPPLQKYAKRLTQYKNEVLWPTGLGIIEKILSCRKSYKDLTCILVLEITENLEIKVFKAAWPWFLGFQVYPAVWLLLWSLQLCHRVWRRNFFSKFPGLPGPPDRI